MAGVLLLNQIFTHMYNDHFYNKIPMLNLLNNNLVSRQMGGKAQVKATWKKEWHVKRRQVRMKALKIPRRAT